MNWKPKFKVGQRVAILGLKRTRGGAYMSTTTLATCVEFVRPTPYLGMEQWKVKFDDGTEKIENITYEAQELCKEELESEKNERK